MQTPSYTHAEAKHSGATTVAVHITDNGPLQFTVHDNGQGFDQTTLTRRHGLTNMHDRITSIGGRLTITSAPGRGTDVTGAIPHPASH
jgi:signal transduction histidine kinase